MSFMLKSFLGGAAEGLTSKLNKDEKDAQELAKIQFATMYKTDQENKSKREELRNKLTSNVEFIRGYFPQLTGDQLFETAKNPAVMDKLVQVSKERDFDPSKVDPNGIVTIAGKATGLNADVLIKDMIDKSIVTAPATKIPEGLGMFERRNRAISEDAFNRQAAAMGVDPDVLRGASQYKTPSLDTKATFNLGVLAKPAGFTEQLEKAKVALVDAMSSGDEAKIQAANTNATRFKIAEDMFKVDPKKTEADIQTDLSSRIIAANKKSDTKTATALTAELRMRQDLAKRPGDDVEKVTQANYIVIASRARASAIENVMPPGTFITIQNPDGTTTPTLKSLAQSDLFLKGLAAGDAAIIKEFSDPKTGLPKSELHKNAMISIGIQFNQEGKPIIGAVKPPPPAATGTGSSGSSAAPRAGTAAPAAVPAPTGSKAVTGKIGEPAAPALAPAPAAAPAQTAAPTKTPEEIKAAIAAANEAIRNNADPVAVKQRLKDQGFPIAGVGIPAAAPAKPK
jgi:hypothetical protein